MIDGFTNLFEGVDFNHTMSSSHIEWYLGEQSNRASSREGGELF